ncbi:MAG: AIPR family protein [Nitrospirae bacterium]|nr:AIPR family protein [Nitrospirota bacterium]MCL5978606.1 AIPR family protein [Nitrospirota bacterium]
MAKSKLNKFILKSDYSRRYPDPLNKTEEGDPYNIEHHIFVIRAIDVPSGMPMTPNPREQRIDKGIYKEVTESLKSTDDLSFHLKNKGITMLAHQVEYGSTDKRIATVSFGENDGIADGGHTYKIILAAQEEGACPEDQYVKFEIITGVPQEMAVDITGGLNTAVQVDDASLMNLEGKFDWVKEVLMQESYADQISYKMNEEGKFDVREILGLMTLFNIEKFPYPQHPKDAYVSKAKCLDLYEDDPDSFKMLRPLLKDILYLYDYVHIMSRKRRNEKVEDAKTAGMKGVYARRKRGDYDFIFIGNKEAKQLSGGKLDAKLYDGVLYPMLGALRFLVEQKKGEKTYSWKLKSFKEVKSFFDEIAPELVNTTYNTCRTYNNKPNPVGKDNNHWDNMYKTVALAYLQRNNT